MDPQGPQGTNLPGGSDGYPQDPYMYGLQWPKQSKSPRKAVKPYLAFFTKFLDLPVEIRQMIWRLTLQGRNIEVEFHSDHGFYSRAIIPTALRVCRDSRTAVRTLFRLLRHCEAG